MTDAATAHLRRLPKVELHCHLEGSARPGTIRDLARKNGVDLKVSDPEALFHFTGLNQFLEIYTLICRSLQTADDYRRITYEALEDAAAVGVRYREMFFSPGFTTQFGVSIQMIWDGIRAGLLEARKDFDLNARMILDFDKPSGADHAAELARFASECDRDLLIGVGADSVESGIDHRILITAYEIAAGRGLRRTMHAGEDGPSENIRIAIDDCGCERIDHGFRLMDDPDLTRRVASEQIPVTSCPTSNVVIANLIPDVASHPFKRMRDAGVLVSLNSDDPAMMGSDLGDEYEAIADAYGYSLAQMEDISLAGIESSWAPDNEIRTMREEFLAEFDRLRTAFGQPLRPT